MPVTAFHTNASGKDRVGLYPKGSVPQSGNPALVWAYVGSDGYTVINLNNKFTTGEYTAYLCANDGYTVIASCDFSVVEKVPALKKAGKRSAIMPAGRMKTDITAIL